ncbi:MAG: hypothetical protein ACTSYM_10870 [Candidatus Baldrarchaeia archaeon]
MSSERDKMFIDEAKRIIDTANEKGIVLRVLGAIAFRLHCPKFRHILESMRCITDIDLMAYGKQMNKVEKHFIDLGYEMRPPSFAALAARRRIFYDRKRSIVVDVFFDKLEMCHDIDFKGRLEIDYPTIPLAEMLLEKLQIVQITEKDVKDVIILLREHEIGENDNDVINAKYIAKIFAKDWGFYYTATTNLKKIKQLLKDFDALTDEDKKIVESRIDKLLNIIEKEPKSLGWKMRAKIGTKKIWYRKVEEIEFPEELEH